MRTRRTAALLVGLLEAILLASTACAQAERGSLHGSSPETQASEAAPGQSPTVPPRFRETPAFPAYVLQGFPEVAASFGYSLAAGDIDGDGCDDVVVGAPWPEVTPGRVLAFLGGDAFGGETDITLRDPEDGAPEGFGYFLTTGDVDGDDEDEVIVGKPTGGGKVFVFSDPVGPAGGPTAVLEDAEHRPGSLLGYPVTAGDVNGDGHDDIIAGAPTMDVGQQDDAGAVLVFLGGDPLDTVQDFVLQAPEPEARSWFGRSVAAGDVNGDGLDDVVVGAHGSSVNGHDSAGKVFVFLSGDAPGQPAVTILQDPVPQPDARLGYSVAAGDVDGDGFDDVIAGAFGSPADRLTGAGKAIIFKGGLQLDATADAVLQDPYPEANAGFGYVLHVTDVNGDSFDDVIVGAPYSNSEGHDAVGKAFLFVGSPTLPREADRTITPPVPQAYGYFGISIASGDIDGNGVADIVVGAYRSAVGGQAGAGKVFVYPFAQPAREG